MTGPERLDIEELEKVCCFQGAQPHILVVTTMWEYVKMEDGEKREQELQDIFLKPIPGVKSRSERFDNQLDSARSIISNLGSLNAHVSRNFGAPSLDKELYLR